MRKFILAGVLALGLGGCAADLAKITPFITGGVANPITKEVLYNAEASAVIAVAGLNVYKKSCDQGVIAQSCKSVITTLQVYTRQIKAILPALRNFVKNNDQVNAVTAYNTLIDLIAGYKAVATANNVKVQ